MLLKFHRSNGPLMLLPFDRILFIQDSPDGGSKIYTSIEVSDSEKTRIFTSRESVEELYRSIHPAYPTAGAFSVA